MDNDAGVPEWSGCGLQNRVRGFDSRHSLCIADTARLCQPRQIAEHDMVAVGGRAEGVFGYEAEVFGAATVAPAACVEGPCLVEVGHIAALVQAQQGVTAR